MHDAFGIPFIFTMEIDSSFQYFFYSFVKLLLLHVIDRRVFCRFGVPALLSGSVNLAIGYLVPICCIVFSICLGFSKTVIHLSIRASYRALQPGWTKLKWFMGRVEMDSIIVALPFGSSQCLPAIFRVWWYILTCVNVLVTICKVLIFMISRCVGLVEVFLLIIVLVWVWAVGFAISKLKIVFVETVIYSETFFFRAVSAINTLNIFLFGVVIVVFVFP